MTRLLDINVLIALAWPSHVHHSLVRDWFARHHEEGWATCPITQLGFVRISSNPRFVDGAVTPLQARDVLSAATGRAHHVFWSDAIDITAAASNLPPFVVGHRQVTDAYLVRLAQQNRGRLVTLDSGVATLLPKARRAEAVEVIALDG